MATTEATYAARGDVMTYEELLAKLNEWEYSDYKAYGSISEWPYKTLRAVVELHKSDGHFCVECSHDVDYLFNYPCKTIQAIEKELA